MIKVEIFFRKKVSQKKIEKENTWISDFFKHCLLNNSDCKPILAKKKREKIQYFLHFLLRRANDSRNTCTYFDFTKFSLFFQISHWRFPECSLRDKFLHFFFIVNVCLMIACAAVTIICFKEIENVSQKLAGKSRAQQLTLELHCHTDFTWNQFWSFWSPKNCHLDHFSSSEFLIFDNFWLFKCGIPKKSQLKAFKIHRNGSFWSSTECGTLT